ncbi:MAG: propanediol utilization protein [Latescibacteria bacterium DG_63]|nr:MAG: propanediol utilization protein [Latescibacteria bacterium DG_63]
MQRDERTPKTSPGEALGLVELNTVAIGIQVADEMLKVAPVTLVEAAPVCAGKYVVIVRGDVASVDASVSRGAASGEECVVDTLFLANPHVDIFPAMTGTSNVEKVDALGVIETFSVASTVVAADAAAKTAKIRLIEIRLAKGLGGRAFVTLTGDVSEVQAAVDAGSAPARKKGVLVRSIVIPRPDEKLFEKML